MEMAEVKQKKSVASRVHVADNSFATVDPLVLLLRSFTVHLHTNARYSRAAAVQKRVHL